MIFARGAVKAACWLIGKPCRALQPWNGCAGIGNARAYDPETMTKDQIFEFFRRLAEDNPHAQTEAGIWQCPTSWWSPSALSAQATDVGVKQGHPRAVRQGRNARSKMVVLGEDGFEKSTSRPSAVQFQGQEM